MKSIKLFFKLLFCFFFPKKEEAYNETNPYTKNTECCDLEECCESTELCVKGVISYPFILELEKQKAKAIEACDGCVNEVLILRLNGEDVGYYKSINQLCDKNGFKKKSSVYHYWKNKQALNKGEMPGLLFGKYDISYMS